MDYSMRAVENAPVLGGAKYPYRARLRTIVPVISRRLGALGMGGCMTLSHPQEGHACDNPHTGSGHRGVPLPYRRANAGAALELSNCLSLEVW